MDKIKVLIGSRQAPEIEAMLSDVPENVEVRFLPYGDPLRAHIADVEILFGHVGEDAMSEANALRWAHQPHAGVEGFMYPQFQSERCCPYELSRLIRHTDRRTRLRAPFIPYPTHSNTVGIYEDKTLGAHTVY